MSRADDQTDGTDRGDGDARGGPIRTPLTDLLGVRHPILLAPMGDSAGGLLAAAVSRAGALGMVGGGYAHVDWLRRELDLAGGARVGIGFITFALDERPEALQVALAADPVAIQLSFGDPRPYAAAIAGAGVPLICGVQTDAEVDRALEAGAAVLVAQGSDGGGHGRPDRATMGLVPSLVDRAGGDALVVAAGGIADGRGLAAALALGAAGVSVGTRFLATAEAISTPAEAAGLVAARAQDTVRTPVIDLVRGPAWPEGHDGRTVRNAFIDRWHGDPTLSEHVDDLHEQYVASDPEDHSIRVLWAGEGLDLIVDVPSAARVVDEMVAGAAQALAASASFLRR